MCYDLYSDIFVLKKGIDNIFKLVLSHILDSYKLKTCDMYEIH